MADSDLFHISGTKTIATGDVYCDYTANIRSIKLDHINTNPLNKYSYIISYDYELSNCHPYIGDSGVMASANYVRFDITCKNADNQELTFSFSGHMIENPSNIGSFYFDSPTPLIEVTNFFNPRYY